jgi:glycerol-3-phosphate dehydrogenase (NAD(P)+)
LAKLELGNIGVVGNGSWGTAITKILTDNANKIRWWVRNEKAVIHLKERNNNPNYLTSVRFAPNAILPTSNLHEIFQHCDTIVIAVPSAYAQSVIEQVAPKVWENKFIISAIKGILPESNLLLNDFLAMRNNFPVKDYLAITGPCHAEEVAMERLSYLTFSGLDDGLTSAAAQAFTNNYIYSSTNHDIWGAQLAAVLKNIYAVGAGIAHSLDYGDNFLSVYITNCYREMFHFLTDHFQRVNPIAAMPDFHTSAYLGDLLVTCYSLHSRNRTLGSMIGKGYSVKAAILEMSMVAEGYYGAKGIHVLANKEQIDMPIAGLIYQILWDNMNPSEAFKMIEKQLW